MVHEATVYHVTTKQFGRSFTLAAPPAAPSSICAQNEDDVLPDGGEEPPGSTGWTSTGTPVATTTAAGIKIRASDEPMLSRISCTARLRVVKVSTESSYPPRGQGGFLHTMQKPISGGRHARRDRPSRLSLLKNRISTEARRFGCRRAGAAHSEGREMLYRTIYLSLNPVAVGGMHSYTKALQLMVGGTISEVLESNTGLQTSNA